jgi:alpha-glucosidase (family GH31 glycosyl hydrolase)
MSSVGGVLDMYFFLGPSPEETVQQYTEAIGRQPLPPYWALGFHLCRWGYNSLDSMIAAYNRTISAGIPLEVQWADIDVFERNLDFTFDQKNFHGLPQFIDYLHANGINI